MNREGKRVLCPQGDGPGQRGGQDPGGPGADGGLAQSAPPHPWKARAAGTGAQSQKGGQGWWGMGLAPGALWAPSWEGRSLGGITQVTGRCPGLLARGRRPDSRLRKVPGDGQQDASSTCSSESGLTKQPVSGPRARLSRGHIFRTLSTPLGPTCLEGVGAESLRLPGHVGRAPHRCF